MLQPPHMSLTSQPRGSCPGVWTPMESGDGLIVRVRPQWGRLTAASLRSIARLALETGNGIIELTRRANLQMRGVSLETWPRLRDELVRLALAPPAPESERRPALLVCALSGLDASGSVLEPLAVELDTLIAELPAASSLSHKFSIVLSGGSCLSGSVAADVHLRLDPASGGLADIVVAGTAHGGVALGRCAQGDAPLVVRRCIEALARSGHGRMRDLALRSERSALISAAGELLPAPHAVAPGGSRRLVGFQVGVRSWVGCAVPFGSGTAAAWSVVADLAEQLGNGEVRLAPSRLVLLPGVSRADASLVLAQLASAGFVTEERSSEVELTACSGAPACRSARGETRRLASELGELLRPLRRRLSVHVSGCAKSCARDGTADVTIVHGAGGAHLGFGADVPGASAVPALPVGALAARVAAYFSAPDAGRHMLQRAGTSA